jgi:hypothetical protein
VGTKLHHLMPRDARVEKNIPPLINQFAVQRADGADLALRFLSDGCDYWDYAC